MTTIDSTAKRHRHLLPRFVTSAVAAEREAFLLQIFALQTGLAHQYPDGVGHPWPWSARLESPAAALNPSTFVIDSIEVVALAFESVRPNSCCRGPEAFRP